MYHIVATPIEFLEMDHEDEHDSVNIFMHELSVTTDTDIINTDDSNIRRNSFGRRSVRYKNNKMSIFQT